MVRFRSLECLCIYHKKCAVQWSHNIIFLQRLKKNWKKLNIKIITWETRNRSAGKISTEVELLRERLQSLRGLVVTGPFHQSGCSGPGFGRCRLHMPLHGGCSSARGPHVAGEPWDPWQTQLHPLLHESLRSKV